MFSKLTKLRSIIRRNFLSVYTKIRHSSYAKFNKINKRLQLRKKFFLNFEIQSYYQAFLKDIFWFKARCSYYLHNWIYTTNHKRIAINYFIFVIFSGITGLILATIIRFELAYPGVGVLSGDSLQYLTIITLHGIIMVFFMIMPLLLGAFGNFLVPTQLGVHDVAFPRLNSASFWFLPSALIMLCHLLCVDRRYQRVNCFNFREVQSLLKRKYFFSLLMSGDSHELHDRTLAALRMRAESVAPLTHSKKLFSKYGLRLGNTKRTFFFDSLFPTRSTPILGEKGLVLENVSVYTFVQNLDLLQQEIYYLIECFFILDFNWKSFYFKFFPQIFYIASLHEQFINIKYQLNLFYTYGIFYIWYNIWLAMEWNASMHYNFWYSIGSFICQQSDIRHTPYNNSILARHVLPYGDAKPDSFFYLLTVAEFELWMHIYDALSWMRDSFYAEASEMNFDFFQNLSILRFTIFAQFYFFYAEFFFNFQPLVLAVPGLHEFLTLKNANGEYFTLQDYFNYLDKAYQLKIIEVMAYFIQARPLVEIIWVESFVFCMENIKLPSFKEFSFLWAAINVNLSLTNFGPFLFFFLNVYEIAGLVYSFFHFMVINISLYCQVVLFFFINNCLIIFDIQWRFAIRHYIFFLNCNKLKLDYSYTFMYMYLYRIFTFYYLCFKATFYQANILFQVERQVFFYSLLQLFYYFHFFLALPFNNSKNFLENSFALNSKQLELDHESSEIFYQLSVKFLLSFFWALIKFPFLAFWRILTCSYYLCLLHIVAWKDFFTLQKLWEYYILFSDAVIRFYDFVEQNLPGYKQLPILTPSKLIVHNLLSYVIHRTSKYWEYFAFNPIFSGPFTNKDVFFKLYANTVDVAANSITHSTLETFHDFRHVRALKPRLKYDDKAGNFFSELRQNLFLQLIPSMSLMTRSLPRPLWFFTDEFRERFSLFFGIWKRNFKQNFLFKIAKYEPDQYRTHFRYYRYTPFNLNFWDIFLNQQGYFLHGCELLPFNWLAVIEANNKFNAMFFDQLFQYRMLSNWRNLRFHREAWRCRALLSRHQKSNFKRYLHEDALFWVVERNARDVLPGWAFITPFSSRTRFTAVGKVDIALAAVFLAGAGSLISSANFLLTYRYLTTLSNKKMRDARAFFSEAVMVSSGMILAANPLLLIAILMLYSDRHWRTSFFDYSGGGDTVLFQHMFWFFGHPEVYIIIMPCFGFTNTILTYYLRKRISARASVLYSMYTIAFLGFFVWGHHMYMVGLSHQTRMLYSTVTVMISVPAATKIIHWLITTVNSTIHFELPLLFTFTFIFLFTSGGISGMFVAHTGMDILFHDTFYVIAHFHVMFAGAAMFSAFAAFYFYFPALFGVKYSRLFAYMHFIYYLIGHLMTFIPMFWLGYAGMPRRILDYPTAFGGWHSIASAGHIVALAGLMSFFFMIIDSIRQSKAAVRTTFGVGRYNTRLNFYYYEIHRLSYIRLKTSGLLKTSAFHNFSWKGYQYSNYEYLETSLLFYVFEDKEAHIKKTNAKHIKKLREKFYKTHTKGPKYHYDKASQEFPYYAKAKLKYKWEK